MTRLTPRQEHVLCYLRDYVIRHGYPPSVREIGEEVGLSSTASVVHVLRRLELKGCLHRDPGISRGLVITWRSS